MTLRASRSSLSLAALVAFAFACKDRHAVPDAASLYDAHATHADARGDAFAHDAAPSNPTPPWATSVLPSGEPRPPEIFHGVATDMPLARARANAPSLFNELGEPRATSDERFEGVEYEFTQREGPGATSVVSELLVRADGVTSAARAAWGEGHNGVVHGVHVTRWFGNASGWRAEARRERGHEMLSFRRYTPLAVIVGDGSIAPAVSAHMIGAALASVRAPLVAQGAVIESLPAAPPDDGPSLLARFAPTEWDDDECVVNVTAGTNGRVNRIELDVPHGRESAERQRIDAIFARAWGTPAREGTGELFTVGGASIVVDAATEAFHVRMATQPAP